MFFLHLQPLLKVCCYIFTYVFLVPMYLYLSCACAVNVLLHLFSLFIFSWCFFVFVFVFLMTFFFFPLQSQLVAIHLKASVFQLSSLTIGRIPFLKLSHPVISYLILASERIIYLVFQFLSLHPCLWVPLSILYNMMMEMFTTWKPLHRLFLH